MMERAGYAVGTVKERYAEIADLIRTDIESGLFDHPDVPFPSTRELAASYKASPPTVSRALDILDGEGLIRRRGNRSAVVIHSSSSLRPELLRRLQAHAARRNETVGAVLERAVTKLMASEPD